MIFDLQENVYWGGFPKLGVPFGGPQNKDAIILGSMVGVPFILGNYLIGKHAAHITC